MRIYRNGTRLYVPPQRQAQYQDDADWGRFVTKHYKLLHAPKIRNKALRKVTMYSTEFIKNGNYADFMKVPRVVYAAVHPRTSKVYVGSTVHNVVERFKSHAYQRFSPKPTGLSKFMAGRPSVQSLSTICTEFFIFPLQKLPDDFPERRFEEVEQEWMRRFAPGRLLNVYRLTTNRRQRHRPAPTGAPSSTPILPESRNFRAATVTHLINMRVEPRLKEMQRMKVNTLRRLKHACPPKHWLRQICDDVITGKVKEDPDAKLRPDVNFVVPFMTTKQDRVNLQQFFASSKELYNPGEVRIVSKLDSTIGSKFFNFTDASIDLKLEQAVCPCALLRAAGLPEKHFCQGHLISADPEVLRSFLNENEMEVTKELCEYGAKFRVGRSTKVAAQMFSVAVHRTFDEAPETWTNALIEHFTTNLQKSNKQPYRLKVNLNELLRKIHAQVVCTPADKNPQKLVFWCQKMYVTQLNLFTESAAFEDCPLLPRDVITIMTQDVQSLGFSAGSNSMPYLWLCPKLHKLEPHRPKLRTIAGKSQKTTPDGMPKTGEGTVMSGLSQFCAKAFNSVIDVLIAEDRRKRIKTCWIIRDRQEAVDMLGDCITDGFITEDFETMYTQLPHEEILANVGEALDDCGAAFTRRFGCTQYQAMNNIEWDIAHNCWLYRPQASRVVYSLEYFKKALKCVLQNTYMRSGQTVVRQVIGLFMGNECSPPVANLDLYVREKRWIQKLIALIGEDAVLRLCNGFRHYGRFIDDRISPRVGSITVNSQEVQLRPTSEDYGLSLKVTGDDPTVLFLGIEVTAQIAGFPQFKCRDKQHSFEFRIVRFPSYDSACPKHIRVGTLVGMLVSALRFTSKVSDVLAESQFLLVQFKNRGYPAAECRHGVIKFADRHICRKYGPLMREKLTKLVDKLFEDDQAPASNQMNNPKAEPASAAAVITTTTSNLVKTTERSNSSVGNTELSTTTTSSGISRPRRDEEKDPFAIFDDKPKRVLRTTLEDDDVIPQMVTSTPPDRDNMQLMLIDADRALTIPLPLEEEEVCSAPFAQEITIVQNVVQNNVVQVFNNNVLNNVDARTANVYNNFDARTAILNVQQDFIRLSQQPRVIDPSRLIDPFLAPDEISMAPKECPMILDEPQDEPQEILCLEGKPTPLAIEYHPVDDQKAVSAGDSVSTSGTRWKSFSQRRGEPPGNVGDTHGGHPEPDLIFEPGAETGSPPLQSRVYRSSSLSSPSDILEAKGEPSVRQVKGEEQEQTTTTTTTTTQQPIKVDQKEQVPSSSNSRRGRIRIGPRPEEILMAVAIGDSIEALTQNRRGIECRRVGEVVRRLSDEVVVIKDADGNIWNVPDKGQVLLSIVVRKH
jgi:hypothetical protein